MNYKVAVLIPCYNEELSISKVVKDFCREIPEADVYVYDNNSTDNTAELALSAGAIVRHEPRQGKGNVVRSMFRNIEADVYLMVDGDDTYPAEDARRMIQMVHEGRCDMVIGDRLSTTYREVNSRKWHNSGNKLVRWLINRIFHTQLHDIMSGYRAMSRHFVKNFPVQSEGFGIETEMTIHALNHHFTIAETAVNYRERTQGSVSKLNTISDGLVVLTTITTLFRDIKPMTFFTFFAAVLAIVSMIMAIPVYLEYLDTGLVPRFPTLIVAGFIMLVAILLWICGIILTVLNSGQKKLYELQLLQSTKNNQ